jgi:hypothetical protein
MVMALDPRQNQLHARAPLLLPALVVILCCDDARIQCARGCNRLKAARQMRLPMRSGWVDEMHDPVRPENRDPNVTTWTVGQLQPIDDY